MNHTRGPRVGPGHPSVRRPTMPSPRFRLRVLRSAAPGVVLVALLSACSREAPAPAIAASPAIADGLALALRIQRDGAGALPEAERKPQIVDGQEVWVFGGDESQLGGGPSLFACVEITAGGLQQFLAHGRVADAVQFSCGSTEKPTEGLLEAALTNGSDTDAILALTTLVHRRAPRSFDDQWTTFCRLDHLHRAKPGWKDVLAAIRTQFEPATVDAHLAKHGPSGMPSQWFLRAAGLLRLTHQIPLLVQLSRGTNLDVSLAAERALEDFPSKVGDDALVQCLLGWQYDAFVRAANALARRNPKLLDETVAEVEVPSRNRYSIGLALAKAHRPSAVPHLCASVGEIQIVDGDMFDAIQRLATDAHWPLVEALPANVREEQRARAEAVVAAVKQRLGR